MKKNMKSVVTKLAPLAENMPTQYLQQTPAAKPNAPVSTEAQVQFSFSLRKSLRKELARLADDEDMTMRSFILNALKEKGLSVEDSDLLDLRKDR